MAPDQFSVARPLKPEDLDRQVTQYGIYPLLPSPNGVPWSEYVRTQRNRPRSVSSSTEALESDHARYITRRIAQHARSMATSTRSLPADSPVPYYQPNERGFESEGRLSDLGSQEGLYAPLFVNPIGKTVNVDGTDYHPNASEMDRVLTYTELDDYDTLFAAGHGRGALDQVPVTSEQMIMTTSMGITTPVTSMGLMVNQLEKVMPTHDIAHSSQREQVSIPKESLKHRAVSPSFEIIGENGAIFTDMTETTLDILDQWMAITPDTQQLKDLSSIDKQIKGTQGGNTTTSDQKESYLDLFLSAAENYRISDQFCGHLDSLSADNNPMVLVELKNLSYQYGTSVYAVDRLMVLCMVNSVWDIKSYLKRPW